MKFAEPKKNKSGCVPVHGSAAKAMAPKVAAVKASAMGPPARATAPRKTSEKAPATSAKVGPKAVAKPPALAGPSERGWVLPKLACIF